MFCKKAYRQTLFSDLRLKKKKYTADAAAMKTAQNQTILATAPKES